MSRPAPHDPLSRLPAERIPEPSPGRVEETLAAAQQLFARQPVQMPARQRKGRPFFGRTWMEAILGAGFVSTACMLAIMVSPAVMLVPSAPEPEPMQSGPIRTDAMSPGRELRPADLDMIADLEPVQFGDLRLGVRNVEGRYAIYHVDERGLELQLLEGRKSAAETISISDAVMGEWSGRQVLAIRSGVGDLQRWEAFVATGPGFELSAALSHQIWDAEGADDVAQRLAALPDG